MGTYEEYLVGYELKCVDVSIVKLVDLIDGSIVCRQLFTLSIETIQLYNCLLSSVNRTNV